jgi:hypothetical protein
LEVIMRIQVLLALIVALIVVGCGEAASSPPEQRVAGPSDRTVLETVVLGPNHRVEFRQLESGLIGVFETGRSDRSPQVKSALAGRFVSLVDTYQKLVPGAQVPESLTAADARYASIVKAIKDEQRLDTVRAREAARHPGMEQQPSAPAASPAVPQASGPSGGARSAFYTDAEQAWFQWLCNYYGSQQCAQAWSWVDSGIIIADVSWWASMAFVGSESPIPGTFVGQHWTGSDWVADFTTTVDPGAFAYNVISAWPAIATHSYFHTTLSGLPGYVQVSMATEWAECGYLGGGVCLNNTCASPAVPVQGQCESVQTQIWNCPYMTSDDVSGTMSLGVSNTGEWGFTGSAHDSGPWGDNYFLGVILDATNAAGAHFGQGHSGFVHGTFDFGSRDDNFTDTGSDQSITDNWSSIVSSGARCHLHWSTDGWLVGEAALVGLFEIGAAVLLGHEQSNGNCYFYRDDKGGIGYGCAVQ